MAGYHNPLYERLTRRLRWPSVRASFWIAFVSGLATLTLTSLSFLQQGLPNVAGLTYVSEVLIVAAFWLLFLAPLIMALVSAAMVSRDASTHNYQMMSLTPIEPKRVVRGYFWASLARMRVLLILVVGLMPALVVGMLRMEVQGFAQGTVSSCQPPSCICIGRFCDPSIEAIVEGIPSRMLRIAILTAHLWVLPLMGAAVGVLTGLHLRVWVTAALAAGVITSFLTVLSVVSVLGWADSNNYAEMRACLCLVTVVVPMIFLGALHVARRWV